MKTTINEKANAVKPLTAKMEDGPSNRSMRVVLGLWPSQEKFSTNWGVKTPQGLAASIDELAGIPKLLADRAVLLAACKSLLQCCIPTGDDTRTDRAMKQCKEAIRQAEGGQS